MASQFVMKKNLTLPTALLLAPVTGLHGKRNVNLMPSGSAVMAKQIAVEIRAALNPEAP